MGGESAERNVSLASGIRIVMALRSRGHDVIAFDPSQGPISGEELERLATSAVGTEPPSLEALEKSTGGAFLPGLQALPEIARADVVFLALHADEPLDCERYRPPRRNNPSHNEQRKSFVLPGSMR